MAETEPASGEDPEIKRAMSVVALDAKRAEARKLAADADSAELASRTVALKAAIGEAPASGFTGAVTAADGAGLAEQNALALRGLEQVATRIVIAALPSLHRGDHTAAATLRPVYLGDGDALPDARAARSFTVQRRLIATALERAIALSDAVGGDGTRMVASFVGAPVAAAGLLLSGVSSLLSYARADATLAGRELKASPRTLLVLVANRLLASGARVRLAGAVPPVADDVLEALVAEVEGLSAQAGDARERAARHAAMVKQLTPQPAAAGTPPASHPNPDPKGSKALHARAAEALSDAVGLFDTFLKAMLADDGGAPGLVRVAEARELDAFLTEARVVLVSLESSTGASLTKKGFASGLSGRVDYSVSAFVTACWRTLDPKSFETLGAGAASHLSPYTALAEVHLKPPAKAGP